MTTEAPKVKIKLYELMGKHNIRTIREMSERSNLSTKAISKALNNKNYKMNIETIAKLCKALDCEIGELIELEGNQ